MQITVTTDDGGVFPLDVSGDLTIRDLKALLEVEAGMSSSQMLLIHNMAPMLEEQKALEAYGVQEGDIIIISPYTGPITTSNPTSNPTPLPQPSTRARQHNPQAQSGASGSSILPPINWGSVPLPGASRTQAGALQNPDNPEELRQRFLSSPYQLAMLQERNPPLAEALLSGDPQKFREALERHQRAVREVEMERIRMINADPFDPEYQRRIAQEIQQKNIEENMEAALEHTPESFSRVVMLYINCKVNGVPVKALVDSGARSTIMSARCAERCNIMRLVDRRFAGVAFGVGTQKIVGRVHLGQIQIGNDFLTSSFQVLEEQAEDMLLGLDMLRKHQCCIDLKHNLLRIGTTENNAPFLTEKDLHEKEEMEKQQAAKGMEDEDVEMARAMATSEEEYEEKIRDLSRQEDHGSGPATASRSPQQSTEQASPQFAESDVQHIVTAGFTRQQALEELQRCNGNLELALASLLAKSIQF